MKRKPSSPMYPTIGLMAILFGLIVMPKKTPEVKRYKYPEIFISFGLEPKPMPGWEVLFVRDSVTVRKDKNKQFKGSIFQIRPQIEKK